MKTLAKILFLHMLFFAVFVICQAEPSTLSDPYAIFHKHYEVMGGLERLKGVKTTYAEGKTIYDGLEGTFRIWKERPLRFRLEEDYSVIEQTEGDDGNFTWLKDTNSQILVHRDEETMKRRRIKELLENYEHLKSGSEFFALIYEGMAPVDGADCYVIKMTNTINKDISWFYFNINDFYLIKSVCKQPDIAIHTTYGDYRPVSGILLPFSEDSLILPREKREAIMVSKFLINIDVEDSLFEIPPKRIRDFHFTKGKSAENIPFTFVENMIYIPVTIGNDTKLWILDSGASMSAVDSDYATSLGLNPQGRVKGYGFGDLFELSFVTLPPYHVGSVRLEPQKIYAFQGFAARSYEPVTVGILGYDFLSRFVTRIDFTAQTISFYDPYTFSYRGKGAVLAAPLKYRTFTLPVTVDGTMSGNWNLDLGAYETSFHYQYAAEHRLLDRKGVTKISRGMSSDVVERTVQFNTVEVGGHKVKNPLINLPLQMGKGASAIGELAGNLGNSILRHFAVYLNYKEQQVILEKGKRFNHPFPRDKSGMTIGRSNDGRPSIAFVATDTPAAKAGFLAGDVIAAVNGVEAGKYGGIIPIRKLLRQKTGTEYLFKVSRNGVLLDIPIALEELF